MIINLKNSKNLSTNDLRNSYQVQWWYIHEFYTNSLSFAALSLVNSSLEQTHIDKHSLLLWQSVYTIPWKKCPLSQHFLWFNDSYHQAIMPLRCKKKYQFPHISGHCTHNEYERNYSGQYQKLYNSHNNSTTIIYSKWAKSRCAIISRG